MIIKLVRHGESEANVGEVHASAVGDAYIKLTKKGQRQAFEAGEMLGSDFIKDALIYKSPYLRTRQTFEHMLKGAQIPEEGSQTYEDPRLREMEFGYNETDVPLEMRERHGWFYFRHPGGESAADCFDRVSTFLESMMRQLQRRPSDKVLIVTHGVIVRCFIMRFLYLSVEQYESLFNPNNCDIITLAHKEKLQNPIFTSKNWGVEGIRVRP